MFEHSPTSQWSVFIFPSSLPSLAMIWLHSFYFAEYLIYTNVSLSMPQSLFQFSSEKKKTKPQNVQHHDIAHFPYHLLKCILKQKESLISKAPSYLAHKIIKKQNKTKQKNPFLEIEPRHLVEESSFCFSVTCVPTFATPWTAPHQTFLSLTISSSFKTHIHWVNDAIQPSHPLSTPSPHVLNLSQHQGLFQ